jgi:DNA-binding response OmpR family regulator
LGDLLSARYPLTLARDGAEAMAALSLQAFYLSIIDLGLPIVDGFRLVQALQVSDGVTSSAVMLLSAHGAPELKVRALELGAVDYMTRPFDPDELMARVARILASVARRFRLTLAPGQTIVPEPNVTLRPRGGLRMQLARR